MAQDICGGDVDPVGEAGEHLGEADVAAVLVDGVPLSLQRLPIVSGRRRGEERGRRRREGGGGREEGEGGGGERGGEGGE